MARRKITTHGEKKMAVRIRKKLYQYMVTYSISGSIKKQSINSESSVANVALANEALNLLIDANQGSVGASITVLAIHGVTDPSQVWPEELSIQSMPADANTNALAGINLSKLSSVHPDDILTADGLPTLAAAGKMQTEELHALAEKLGITSHAGMKYPQLKKVTLAALEERLTAPAAA